MSRYAEGTTVDAPQSRADIERTVTRFGADGFAFGNDIANRRAMVGFRIRDRQIRFTIELPDISDRAFTHSPTGRKRDPASAAAEYRKEVRRRWRALALVIKAKLTAVNEGIVEFEAEFLAQTVMPDGRTVAEHTMPIVARALATGQVPAALLALEAAP